MNYHPDLVERRLVPEQSLDSQVRHVIDAFFDHPSLHTYYRDKGGIREYYNHSTEKYESVLVGNFGETGQTREITVSSVSQIVTIIQPFDESLGVVRWEGLRLFKDDDEKFRAELVKRYYQYNARGEAVELPHTILKIPIRPEQVLHEANEVLKTFRVRYDLARQT